MTTNYDLGCDGDEQFSIQNVEMPALDEEVPFSGRDHTCAVIVPDTNSSNPILEFYAEKLRVLPSHLKIEYKSDIESLFQFARQARESKVMMAIFIHKISGRLGDRERLVELVGQVMRAPISKSEMSKLLAVGKLLTMHPQLPRTLAATTVYQLSLLDEHDIDVVVENGSYHGVPLTDLTAGQIESMRKADKARRKKRAAEIVSGMNPPITKTSEETRERLGTIADDLEDASDGLGGEDAGLRRSITRVIRKIREWLE